MASLRTASAAPARSTSLQIDAGRFGAPRFCLISMTNGLFCGFMILTLLVDFIIATV
ncbi:hypothetical protein MAXJ12_31547 [Mesorhizobium alhagi CCNWXJ12-2]|uniref:Uncharacterized protein n=1 Tax=Mesorhizobium alhagi CCNWXJ12-2 TaxID=1107882 RepID=H0I1H2_9HYPH|nr:hypothetical protein MAXJ12_31547 [Mesorhizobium alhagi CCNWXJ12-2]